MTDWDKTGEETRDEDTEVPNGYAPTELSRCDGCLPVYR